MTTILGMNTKDGVWVAGDRQATEGNLKIQEPFHKILNIEGNASPILIGTTGSVGECQQILKRTTQQTAIKKVISGQNQNIEPNEFADELASFCWDLSNMDIYNWKGASFLVGGYNSSEQTTELFSVNRDGSCVQVKQYYADGSGSSIALGILNKTWRYDLTKEEARDFILEAVDSSTKSDIYSGNGVEVYLIKNNGEVETFGDAPVDPKEEYEAKQKQKVENKDENTNLHKDFN